MLLLPKITLGLVISFLSPLCIMAAGSIDDEKEYRLLATTRTSTMQKEMNKVAAQGFRFSDMMGGETAFGGKEIVTAMERRAASGNAKRFEYMLLATSKTSTMQKELRAAGEKGYAYAGQSVTETAWGAFEEEVVVVLERPVGNNTPTRYIYKLLATRRTRSMHKELNRAGSKGFKLQGLTVSKTSFGGKEVVAILMKTED